MFSQRRKQEGILCTNDHGASLWVHQLSGKFNFLTHLFVCDNFASSKNKPFVNMNMKYLGYFIVFCILLVWGG